jgi:ferritin-like metal-binding protein YciE
MAAYGAVCAIAKVLGETKHASLLDQTLEEETDTDEKLTELAEKINSQANEESPRKEQGEAKPGVKTSKRVA